MCCPPGWVICPNFERNVVQVNDFCLIVCQNDLTKPRSRHSSAYNFEHIQVLFCHPYKFFVM